MVEVVVYTTRWCPYCIRAKGLLNRKGISFNEVPVDGDRALREDMAGRAGRTSVPQIWIGDQHIGGCDELYALERAGRLGPMLQSEWVQGG
jgi:glutaredoxin 3